MSVAAASTNPPGARRAATRHFAHASCDLTAECLESPRTIRWRFARVRATFTRSRDVNAPPPPPSPHSDSTMTSFSWP